MDPVHETRPKYTPRQFLDGSSLALVRLFNSDLPLFLALTEDDARLLPVALRLRRARSCTVRLTYPTSRNGEIC